MILITPTHDLAQVERAVIEDALRVAQGNKAEAARMCGIGKSTLYRRLEEYVAQDVAAFKLALWREKNRQPSQNGTHRQNGSCLQSIESGRAQER